MSGSTVTIAGKQGFVNFCIVSRTQFSHTSYIIILKFLLHGLNLPVKTSVILSRKSLNLKDVRNPKEPRWNAITGGQLHCCERKRIRGMTSYLKRVKEEQYLWGVLIHFFSSVSEKKTLPHDPKVIATLARVQPPSIPWVEDGTSAHGSQLQSLQ